MSLKMQRVVVVASMLMLGVTSCARDDGDNGDAGTVNGVRCNCEGRVEAEAFAGIGAIDCSRNDTPGDSRRCVSEAVAARQPFVLEQDASGDGVALSFLLGNDQGEVFNALFDEDRSRVGACPTFDIGRCTFFVVSDALDFPGASIFNCSVNPGPNNTARTCGRPFLQ